MTVTLNIVGAINLKGSLPITIGNVPFRGIESAKGGNSTYPASQNVSSASSAPNPPPFTDPYAPIGLADESFSYSPAYPSVKIGLEEHTMGETQYAPVYSFVNDYRFAPPPSYAEATVKVKGKED